MAEILILYYSKSGSVKNMASIIARGVNSVDGVSAKIRTVQEVSVSLNEKEKLVPDSGSPYATLDDLKNCDGLALGSPTRFGNMAAHLKFFLDSASSVWLKGSLEINQLVFLPLQAQIMGATNQLY
jgi:NAD(P)H dehydrogenase (quinone)